MNLDDLTIGQLKQLQNLSLGNVQPAIHFTQKFIGMKVIVRTYSAGVHFGTVQEYDPNSCTIMLKDARRLWKVKNSDTGSVTQTAIKGIDSSQSRVDPVVSQHIITEVIEILPASEEAIKTIEGAK